MNTSQFPSPSNSKHTRQTVINSLCFQGMWFATIYMASLKHSTWAIVPPLILSLYYLLQNHPFITVRDRAIFGGIGLSLGTISELLFWYLNLFSPVNEPLFLIPLWLLGLWLALFMMMPLELRSLLNRPVLAATLAFLSAPFSYISGAKLGAMVMNDHIVKTGLHVSIVWAFALYIAALLYQKIYNAD